MTIPDINPSDWWFADMMDAEVAEKIGRLVGGVTASNIVSLVPSDPCTPGGGLGIYGMDFNRVIQLNQDDVWAYTHTGIYKSTDIGSSWTLIATFVDDYTSNTAYRAMKSGLYHYSDSSGTYIFGTYTSTPSGYIKGWKLDTATNTLWTSTGGAGSPTYTGQRRAGEIYYRGDLYVSYRYGNSTIVGNVLFNPVNMTVREIDHVNFSTYNGADHTMFVGDDGALYKFNVTASGGGGGRLHFAKLEGGLWSQPTQPTAAIDDPDGNNNSNNWWRGTAFRDPETNDTAVFMLTNVGSTTGPQGWTCVRMTAPYTAGITFDSTLVVPSALSRYGSATTQANKSCHSFVDVQADVSTPPIFLFFWEYPVGGTVDVYQWKGFSAQLRHVGTMSGVLSSSAFPYSCSYPDAGRTVGNGQDRGKVEYVSDSGIYTKIHYTLDGSGGSETIRIRWFDVKNGTSGLCNFVSGTGSGTTTASGQEVTGVTADGTTVHSVDWDFEADGLARGAPGIVLIVEYETGV